MPKKVKECGNVLCVNVVKKGKYCREECTYHDAEPKKGDAWRRGYQQGYVEGRQAVIDEVVEENRKFREGFNYKPNKIKS